MCRCVSCAAEASRSLDFGTTGQPAKRHTGRELELVITALQSRNYVWRESVDDDVPALPDIDSALCWDSALS